MITLQRKRDHGRVMLLGMSRPHFSYCIVSGRKAGAPT